MLSKAGVFHVLLPALFQLSHTYLKKKGGTLALRVDVTNQTILFNEMPLFVDMRLCRSHSLQQIFLFSCKIFVDTCLILSKVFKEDYFEYTYYFWCL